MAFFSFFRTPKHQRFNYIPRYYDPKKEKLEEILRNAREGNTQVSTEMMKARISRNFRQRNSSAYTYRISKASRRSNILLIIIMIILFGLSYVLLTVYLPRIT